MLGHDADHRRRVPLVTLEGPMRFAISADLRYARPVISAVIAAASRALVRVVRQAARDQQRAEVRVADPSWR